MNTTGTVRPALHAPVLLQQPFRPLFLCSSGFAAFGIFLWAMFLHLGLLPASALPPLEWHGHEMLFGFASALVAGFMLTAVAEWTKLTTFTSGSLALLVLVWIAARVLFLLPSHVPYLAAAIVDCAFFALLLAMIARPIVKSRNRRNYFIVALLAAFTLADIAFHLGARGLIPLSATRVLFWVIDLFTILMLAIGGRVIPFFTSRKLPQAKVRHWRGLDWSVNSGAALLLLLDIVLPGSEILGVVSFAVAALILVRWWNWQPWSTLREPMLWVLHLGYLWLAAGLALRGVALVSGAFAEVTALHAITAGALGSLAIGMMTRVALGHSGRAMTAGPFMSTAFALVSVGAVLRLIGTPGLLPIAGVVWALAFAIYFVRFVPVMFTPRHA